MNTFGRPTITEEAQEETERLLRRFLESDLEPKLHRKTHTDYLRNNFSLMAEHVQSLHCSRPWLCYWILHAADLLGVTRDLYRQVPAAVIADFLFMCFSNDDVGGTPRVKAGGFGGGPGQLPHLATTYAAVCALCILSEASFIRRVNREALTEWLVSLRDDRDGSFAMHTGGERDVRASYCVMVVTTLLDLPREQVCPLPLCAQYVASCQTFEGGITNASDGTEAHGGYTQCALGALILMKSFDLLDVDALRRWIAVRQMGYEGGFNGRTNKLVDSCYSHWIGSSAAILRIATSMAKFHRQERMTLHDLLILEYGQFVDLESVVIDAEAIKEFEEEQKESRVAVDAEWARRLNETRNARRAAAAVGSEEETLADAEGAASSSEFETISSEGGGDDVSGVESSAITRVADTRGDMIFNQLALQNYVFRCCQEEKYGGLMDKPNHPNDYYHTCYSLSGCSVAANSFYSPCSMTNVMETAVARKWLPPSANNGEPLALGGDRALVVRTTNPIFNLCKERVAFAMRTFAGRSYII